MIKREKVVEIEYKKSKNLRDAVRKQCLECNGCKVVRNEEDCTGVSCYLYPYRPWDGPGKVAKRKVSEKQKEILLKMVKKSVKKRTHE